MVYRTSTVLLVRQQWWSCSTHSVAQLSWNLLFTPTLCTTSMELAVYTHSLHPIGPSAPQWPIKIARRPSLRCRFLVCTHDAPPWCVRVDEQTKSRKSPALGSFCRSFELAVLDRKVFPRRFHQRRVPALAKKSGNIFRVGLFLDFVWLTTRTPHGAYVRRARRNRIDPHGGEIERLAGRVLGVVLLRAAPVKLDGVKAEALSCRMSPW